MVSKTQPVIPPTPPIHLETIFEESGSSHSSSIVDIHHQLYNRQNSSQHNTNQTVHGLISARSIPSVDIQRRTRFIEHQSKLPIEVRFRDGTKRFIHPSTKAITNRRKPIPSFSSSSSSSHQDSSSNKTRQIINPITTNKKKSPKKPEIVLTIISAADLSEAGITPNSTSSPDESDTLALVKTHSNSSLDTIQTVKDTSLKDIDEVPTTTIPSSVQPVTDNSLSNHYVPSASHYQSQHAPQLRHPQQVPDIRSQSLPPNQTHNLPLVQPKTLANQIPPVAVVPPSPKKPHSSLQITVKNNENEKNLSSKTKQTSTSKQPFRPSATVLVGGGSRSAFRPFHKSKNLNSQSKISPNNHTTKSQTSTQSSIPTLPKAQKVISSTQYQSLPSTNSSTNKHFSLQTSITINQVNYDQSMFTSDASNSRINSLLSNQISLDTQMNSTSKKKISNHPKSTATNYFDSTPLISIDPTLPWHSVTSKSLYDVPRLSHQYSDIPLRIIIPEGTPTHNQKLVQKHDIDLEKRLLNAGLSPETIALYERILEVADIHLNNSTSPPEIIDQYFHKSLI